MKILRVFPRRTSYTPNDSMTFIGPPPFAGMIPAHDEIHISCVFTWDRAECELLRDMWALNTDKPVRIGGPAYGSPTDDFVPGRYVANGITFTSRGCNKNCPWCGVPKFEGALRELLIGEGRIIQDNNFLQCSRQHKDRVFDMLRGQKKIQFKGGLETELVDDHFVNAVTSLRIDELWLACDTDTALPRFKRACEKLKRAGFSRDKIRCYALIGDDMSKNEARLLEIYHAGAMPFAQLYQPFEDKKAEYPIEWRRFQRQWSRPAAIRAHIERGTLYSQK